MKKVSQVQFLEEVRLMPSVEDYELEGTSWILNPPSTHTLHVGVYTFHFDGHGVYLADKAGARVSPELKPFEVEALVEAGVAKWVTPFGADTTEKLKRNREW
jgi:hypothetical protein